ncbi:MAG: IS110 family transposase [Candidatus Lokiarchaeota archaeon]|nr:IS110 family transposase [Candidatus Lokiarchaeota archaeon]MBD3339889.1 IS110 family transposase [Candidatus Lokiarchaeota archaeon]
MEEVEFKFSVDYSKPAFYCGLDVHKYELAVAVYCQDDSQSEFLKTNVFTVDNTGLAQFWNFVRKYRPDGFAMEATGIYHHVVYKFLMNKRESVDWPFKILVVNPADASGIPNRQKFDRIDAELLARYLAKDLLTSGKAVIEVMEDIKAVFRMALRIEKDRTALKNRIKKTLDRAGIRPKGLNLNHDWVREFLHFFIEEKQTLIECLNNIKEDNGILKTHRHKILKNVKKFVPYGDFDLTNIQRSMIRQDLIELGLKTARKSLLTVEIDQAIVDHSALRQQAYNLSTIPGISPFSAVWILAEIGHINQFKSMRQFLSYCGCSPRVVSSAGKVYSAHVSRHSNSYLRTIFYNAAVEVCNFVKKDSLLKQYATRTLYRKRSASLKLAYCHVAAKIARISYAILKKSKRFEPFHNVRAKTNISEERNTQLTLTTRKLIRKAKNALKRVNELYEVEILEDHISHLAKQLDLVLQGKKPSA